MRKEINDWFEQSLAEKKTAIDCASSKNYYAAAFHPHQAVEFGLKALYISKKRKLPKKTHSILELAKELNLSERIVEIARELSPLYTLTRYPDAAGDAPFKIYSKEKVSLLIEMMEELVKWLESSIQK